MIHFSNTYENLPKNFYEKINPEKFSHPELIVFNEKLATELKIEYEGVSKKELAHIFSGQKILPGSNPLAMAYAGFQFGHPVAQLGDGRAHLLGEVKGYDIQLKGSGKTRFSRRGDGRSALGPVLREYIVSEAMHHLGVPTTRSLCAVASGEQVQRQEGVRKGGILTRVASSHIRVGTFQYFAFQNDLKSIQTLMDYSIKRHYPELTDVSEDSQKSIQLLKKMIQRQSKLVAQWSALGFIHGVMNTDNFSLGGITLDYGPCAFMDEFKFQKVFSSIDHKGRYSFFNQVPVAQWNILRLAECLLPFIEKDRERAKRIVEEEILDLFPQFEEDRMSHFAAKIGIQNYQKSDDPLILEFLKYLEKESLDFTLAFRKLPDLFHGPCSFYPENQSLVNFVNLWRKRVTHVHELNQINPIYIPRNHQVEKVIAEAERNHFDPLHKLLKVNENPYTDIEEYREFAKAPLLKERIYQTFCGT